MAYYLEFDGVDDYVTGVSYPRNFIGDGTAWDFEFQAWNSGSDEFAVIGGSNYLILRSDNTIDAGGGSHTFSVTDVTDPDAVYRFELRIAVGGARTLELFENDVSVGSQSTSISEFAGDNIGQAAIERAGSLKYIKYTDYNQSSNDRFYDPSATNGTGSILPDTINGQDGTLVNFPTDDSQWVFYDDGAGGTDDLTANDITSTSQVSSPAIAQTHALTANDASSLSTVSSPALGQTHSLTATDVQSTSELTQPALSSASTVDSLSANDISSASTASAPALGQVHNLAANDATANSETGTTTLRQEHALTSVDASSLSTVSSPSLTEIAGQDSLAANDVESTTSVTSPTIGQVHNLTANDLDSQSETSQSAIGQVHSLTANNLSSATQVSSPTLRDASQVLVTPIKNTKATVSQTTYKAAIIQTVYKAEAG